MTERSRLALWTPLPPIQNGIADYSLELLAYLAHFYDIEVFIDNGYEPSSWLSRQYKISSYTAFETQHDVKPFDVIIYQLGGSNSHHYMFQAIQRWPGLVVLHDLFMGLSLYKYCTLRGNPNKQFARYLRREGQQIEQEFKALRRLHGPSHDLAVDKFFNSHYFLSWIIDHSLGQIVHMPYAAHELRQMYPKAQPFVINMGVQTYDVSVSVEALRSQFGIDPSTFVIGIFGKINKHKGLETCLAAVDQLIREHPNVLVVIVGPYIYSEYMAQLHSLVNEYGLQRQVHFAGYLDRSRFAQLLAISDVVINLRYPGQMQMSATLIRALAAAKPVIVSDIPEWNMLPDNVCLKLAHNGNEVEVLKDYLTNLIVDPTVRKRLSANAENYADKYTTVQHMAAQYVQVIDEIVVGSRQRTSTAQLELAPEILNALSKEPLRTELSHVRALNLPVEDTLIRDTFQLLKEWHRLQNTISVNPVLQQRPIFLGFLLNVVRRIRYLGLVWQIQGLLFNAMNRRNEILTRKIDHLDAQYNTLKTEIEQIRKELGL
jgi:glycosyltransferase involved in cell wall biosynthesis